MIERERWQEVEAILDQVLDLPPGERPARLAALELEPEIRAEVDELLAAERAAGSFLEVPAAAHLSSPAADESALPALAAGELVGPYRISREIGRGGMGEVYEAWDTRLERRVALKRVRLEPGDDGAARRLRFRR